MRVYIYARARKAIPLSQRRKVLEKSIETKLVAEVRKAGGWAVKFLPYELGGMPDRLVICPNGSSCWVELKDTGKTPRVLQAYRHKQLRELNQVVFVVDGDAGIAEVVEYVRRK